MLDVDEDWEAGGPAHTWPPGCRQVAQRSWAHAGHSTGQEASSLLAWTRAPHAEHRAWASP
eukprot:11168716-Lingulodinium_polyedra.AAC.1